MDHAEIALTPVFATNCLLAAWRRAVLDAIIMVESSRGRIGRGMMNERGWEEGGCGGLRLFSSPRIAAASQYFLAKAWDGVLARREPSLLLLWVC